MPKKIFFQCFNSFNESTFSDVYTNTTKMISNNNLSHVCPCTNGFSLSCVCVFFFMLSLSFSFCRGLSLVLLILFFFVCELSKQRFHGDRFCFDFILLTEFSVSLSFASWFFEFECVFFVFRTNILNIRRHTHTHEFAEKIHHSKHTHTHVL